MRLTIEQHRQIRADAAARTAHAQTIDGHVVAWTPRASSINPERTVFDVTLNGYKINGGALSSVGSFTDYLRIAQGLRCKV